MAAGDEILEAVAETLGRIAEELAFAEPGTDTGLLPVNALLMDLEHLPPGTLPASLASGLRFARAWVDATLDGSGRFDGATLQHLSLWHGWMTDCAMSEAAGMEPPLPPAAIQMAAVEPEAVIASVPAAPMVATPPAVAPAVVIEPAADVPVMVLKLPGEADMLAEFHSESLELLRAIERAVLTLEESPGNAEAVNAIFRAFHTFKGSAGFLQLDALRDFAHELESLLEGVRSGAVPVTRLVIDAILAGADVLGSCTQAVGAQVAGVNAGAPIPVDSGPVLVRVRAALRGEASVPAAAAAREATPPPASPLPTTPEVATVSAVAVGSGPGRGVPTAVAPAAPAVSDNFVRLDASKLDALVNLVGELMVAQAFVVESPAVRDAD
ncbi:MAG: Hpt domain-containing protein, partial [Gammaproteobacteria bacterium]